MIKQQSGFTIVELIVYSGILLIFLYVMTSMFTAVLDTQLESESTSAVIEDGRFLFSRFAYDIGRASAIVQPATLGQETTTLTLHIGTADYTYAVTNGKLILTDPSSSGTLNSYGTKISNVTFRRYGNVNGKNSVRIAFTLTSIVQRVSGPQSRDFETTLGLR